MLRAIGRILLLVVGIALIAFAVPTLIEDYKLVSTNGLDFNYILSHPELLSSLLSQLVNLSFGVTAVFAALTGKSSIKLAFASIIMIAGVIWFYYSANQAGTLGDWKNILQTALGFALPIGYFIGTLILTLVPRKIV